MEGTDQGIAFVNATRNRFVLQDWVRNLLVGVAGIHVIGGKERRHELHVTSCSSDMKRKPSAIGHACLRAVNDLNPLEQVA